MSSTDPHSSAEPKSRVDPEIELATSDGWHQLESFVDQMHETANSPIEAEDFYRELLDGCVTLLAAEGGCIWLPEPRGRWRAAHQINGASILEAEEVAHSSLLHGVAGTNQASLLQPKSSADVGENTTDLVLLLAPVVDTVEPSSRQSVHAIVELALRTGSSPAVQRGWRELLETIARIASDFHVRDQLRNLREQRGFYDQSLLLMRRLQQNTDLRSLGYDIANEGRRFVGADRLTVVVKRGSTWRVLAASGVDRVEPRADVTKRLQQLASATADWGRTDRVRRCHVGKCE